MDEQNSKGLLSVLLAVIIIAVVVSGGMYWWQSSQAPQSTTEPETKRVYGTSTEPKTTEGAAASNQVVEYNCKQSGGAYSNGACICSDSEYEKSTGYCITAFGNPGGELQKEAAKLQELVMFKLAQAQGKNTEKIYTSRNGLKFNYFLGWQILHHGFKHDDTPAVDKYLELKLKRFDQIFINFENPHDIEPYEFYPDVRIADLIFETPLKSPEEFLELTQKGVAQKGIIQNYQSKNGVNFKVLHVSNLNYESDYVYYVTEYTNKDGKHLVEILRMGTGFEKIEKEIKSIIDSFQVPGRLKKTL